MCGLQQTVIVEAVQTNRKRLSFVLDASISSTWLETTLASF